MERHYCDECETVITPDGKTRGFLGKDHVKMGDVNVTFDGDHTDRPELCSDCFVRRVIAAAAMHFGDGIEAVASRVIDKINRDSRKKLKAATSPYDLGGMKKAAEGSRR